MNENINRENSHREGQHSPFERNLKQSSTTNTDIDDIFDQTDNVHYEKELANKQYDKYVGKFYNEGFREALYFLEDEAGAQPTNSKNEHALQISFDKGYETAFILAKEVTTLRNAAKIYLEFAKDDPDVLLSNDLTELQKLSTDLDLAKVKIDELVNGGTITATVDKDSEQQAKNTNISIEQEVDRLDGNWCSKFTEIIRLQELRNRCKLILDIVV
jgi:hypothetical protein